MAFMAGMTDPTPRTQKNADCIFFFRLAEDTKPVLDEDDARVVKHVEGHFWSKRHSLEEGEVKTGVVVGKGGEGRGVRRTRPSDMPVQPP